MMIRVAGVVLAFSPILSIVVLLGLAAWREGVREARVARQIRVTDAIGAELGAIVAPVVEKSLGGPWRVRIVAPLERPDLVARILAITHRVLARTTGRYEIVLTSAPAGPIPEATPAAAPSRLRAA